MLTNRPMFDDEDLPDWLKNAGITYAGQKGTSAQPPPPTPPPGKGLTSMLPWKGDEGTPDEQKPAAPRLPGTGLLPWLKESSSAPAASASGAPSVDVGPMPWESPTAADASSATALPKSTGVTGFLPWRNEGGDEPAPSTEPKPWEVPAEPSSAPAYVPPPPEPLPSSGDDAWLASMRDEVEAAPPEPEPPSLKHRVIFPPPETPIEPEPVAPASDDDWLASMRDGVDTSQPADDAWLNEIDETPTATAPAAPLLDEAAEDWLNAVASTSAPEPVEPSFSLDADMFADLAAGPSTQEPAAAGDDWMQAFAGDAAPAAPEPARSDANVLDALYNLRSTEPEPPQAAPAADDWLDSMLTEPPADSPAPVPAAPPAADGGMDLDWLDTALSEPPQAPPPQPVKLIKPLKSKAAEPEPAHEPVALPAPATQPAPVDDVPDWFKEASPAVETPPIAAPAPSVDVDEVPDWFKDMGDAAAPAASTPPPTPPPAPEEIPPKRVLPVPDLPPEQKQPEPIPDWMSSSTSLIDKRAPLEVAPEPADDMPDWMKDMAPIAPSQPVVSQLAAEEELDWLNDSLSVETPPTASSDLLATPLPSIESDVEPELQLGEVSSLDIEALLNLPSSGTLDELRAAQQAEMEVPEPEAEAAAFDLNKPLDLDELLGPAPEIPATPEIPLGAQVDAVLPPTPAEHVAQASTEIVPQWVADMRPADAPIMLRIGDQPVKVEQLPLAQLSPQVRQLLERVKPFQDAQKTKPAAPVASTAPAAGPLAGVTDAISTAPDVFLPGISTMVTNIAISDAHLRRVKQLQALMAAQDEILAKRAEARESATAESAEAARLVKPARQQAKFKFDRLVVALLLAVILIAPFFTNALNIVAAPTRAALSDESRAMFDHASTAFDSLRSGDVALVAFEYGPTGAGELDDLAKVVLRVLFQKHVRAFIVSTNPAGALHAQGLVGDIAANKDEVKIIGRAVAPRKDYVVLRYLPGGAAGVRAVVNALDTPGLGRQIIFGTDLDGQAVALTDAELLSLRQSPAFVIAETQDNVRDWAEQYRSVSAGVQTLKLVLCSSASAAATAQTYARTADRGPSNIAGVLVGLRDAIIYQTEKQLFPSTAAQTLLNQRWQSVGLSALMAATIILFGIIINGLRSLRRRGPRASRK